jgi:PAS domain S-box-containing protein
MTLTQTEIQVLYEIALSIGAKKDLEQTVEAALATYLQKLDCSAAGVVERTDELGWPAYEMVATVPAQSSVTELLRSVPERLPDDDESLWAALPLVEKVDHRTHLYVMQLGSFGVLALVRRGAELPDHILSALRPLNRKLAEACDRVVVQTQYETQYRELFRDAPVMFALTRAVGGEPVIEDCNTQFAETLGVNQPALRGRSLADLYTVGSREQLLAGGFRRALAGESVIDTRQFPTEDGRDITTLMRAAPRRDRDGEVIGTNVLYIDITELKQRNEQLTVLNRVLRHNLRNELTIISGNLDIAAETVGGRTADPIDTAQRRVDSLKSIAETASRVQRVIEDTDIERVDLVDVVESVVERAHGRYPDATLDLDAPNHVPVRATRTVRLGLWELVENACEHAGRRPQVETTVELREQTAVVDVVDDGPGIPEHEYQVLETGEETSLSHGSGLGLWLAKWAVEAVGGTLRFATQDGTRVRAEFTLDDAVTETAVKGTPRDAVRRSPRHD